MIVTVNEELDDDSHSMIIVIVINVIVIVHDFDDVIGDDIFYDK